jgi:molybdopterin-guanine dinucleotide biosynthesis protein
MINNRRTTIVGIGGLTSEVGKTTLLCKLLGAFPGWEAIKTTRGHYRSCGKDPHSCCVSDLLSDEPTIISGRELTYAVGKDTGRYWDAGAANVHWVIATDEQVQTGINEALERVTAPGVFIEGNSFTEYVKPDFYVMVADSKMLNMKRTARRAISHASAVYVSNVSAADGFESVSKLLRDTDLQHNIEFFCGDQFAVLVGRIRAKTLNSSAAVDNRLKVKSILDSPDNKGLTISKQKLVS